MQDKASWTGSAEHLRDSSSPAGSTTLRGNGETRNTLVDVSGNNTHLINMDRLAFEGLLIDDNGTLKVRRLQANGLQALQPINAPIQGKVQALSSLAKIGAISAERLSLEENSRLVVQRVAIGNANVNFERQENGELRLVGSVLKILRPSKPTVTPEQSKGPNFTFAVRDWFVEGDSRLAFTDRSVKPPAKVIISPIAIHLTNLDSAAPEQAVPIQLSGILGKYAKFNLMGTMKPFSERLNLDIAGKLKGFELTTLSGYSGKYLGYNLNHGRLDTNVRVKITDGRLQSTSNLVISNLGVVPTNPNLQDPLQKRLELPFDTALSLLRDSEDVIRLKIPVTGDVLSPQFDLSETVNRAIGNAMKKTILTMVKVAFPVGGLIVTLAEHKGKAALRLQPILFAAGEFQLDANDTSHLAQLSELLKARPNSKITICSWVTKRDGAVLVEQGKAKARATARQGNTENRFGVPDDFEALGAEGRKTAQSKPATLVDTTTELLSLGRKRSESVKDQLLSYHNVIEERVDICAPKIDESSEASPRVEISF